MKAPFPWFGGKRRVADVIWRAFGDVDNYVEPFAGSLAVLLERPTWHRAACETVNDADRYLANFWRALSKDPQAVAEHCDWPVNEADLEARHLWLVNAGRERIAAMFDDPDFFDPKVAGWWVWGVNQWIGSGWCSGEGPHGGVNKKLPHLGDAGRGVNRQLLYLSGGGKASTPSGCFFDDGLRTYFAAIAERLRRVRVCCGDWARVVTDGATSYGTTVGVLLDPPYSGEFRAKGLYATEGHDIGPAVREWAISKGDDPRFRIALCGYEGEHELPPTWHKHVWSSTGAYKGGSGNDQNAEVHRHLERIWFSPACAKSGQKLLLTQ